MMPLVMWKENYWMILFDFINLINILKKRKFLFFTSYFTTFLASIVFVGLAHIIFPTYRGAFKILINDPITKKNFYNERLQKQGELVFDLAARSTDVVSNDIPTLLEYLKSEAILIPVLDKFNIRYDNLNSNLSVNVIDNAKDFDKPAQVLYVSLNYKNKKTGHEY